MSAEVDSADLSLEYQHSVSYVKEGFTKLAAQSWNQENEILYQSSRDYAETAIKDWTSDLYSKALLYLSKHILNPRHTAKILFLFEQCILKIVRYALASEADNQTKYSALRIILKYKPHILQYCLSHFDDKPPPWEEDRSDPKLPKKMKMANSEVSDLEIVECCWILLKSNLNYFKSKWDWSDFINKYLPHKDLEICWIACQTTAMVLGMNESSKLTLIEKYMSLERHYDFSVQYEVDKQSSHSIAMETLNYDANPSRVFMPLYKQTVSDLTVDIVGVTLDVKNIDHQVKEGCLVETVSTQYNLRRIAVAIQTGKAICLVGPVGSGKTSLISHIALLTGRNLSTDLLKVQLGEETDSKLLLGSYQCTDIPGEFVWSPGMLTKAVLEGRWLLLEDIESATSDVAALLANLLEENTITIPGFKDSVRPAPGFHLFMTHRLVGTLSLIQRKDTFSTELLERHWFRINLEPLAKDELVQIIQTKYPLLKTIAAQMTSVYLLFSQGHHEESDAVVHSAGTRLISTRDLFKWCRRAEIDFDVSSVESALKVLQDAIDIFCCSYSSEEKRLELAGEVAACLGIIKMKAEYFCTLYKPNVNLTTVSCVAGRGVLPRVDFSSVSSLKSLLDGLRFAMTRGSACLLERVAVCLSLDEPALLVGETGTGKTTSLQLLAQQTGHKLVVINMNQQSDSSDLLGGYKPIDTKQVVMPLRDEFEELFRNLFIVEKNLKFLENISVCISNKRWLTLMKLMIASQKAAVRRLIENKDDVMLARWMKLGEKLFKLQTQLKQNEAAMAFSFVEGSLIQAMKAGHWVLLDEINLASAETLQCLSGLLEGSTIHLLERGDEKSIKKHPDFRIMAAMNPATDFGKKDLPPGIRNRFTEIFVSEHTERGDLALVVNCYLPDQPSAKVDLIVNFYLNVRKCAIEILTDGSGNRPHYSLRTLCRALVITSENRCGSMARSLYEGFCLSFLTQLSPASHAIVRDMIGKTAIDKGSLKSILNQPIPEPVGKQKYICFEGYWVSKGDYTPHSSKKYILTESVRTNLSDLARIVSLSNHPVLIQGGTSVGKTSLIIYLAEGSGHRVLRINNHQHTDLQEYVGTYCADSETGSLVFKEGVLAQAMRRGDWIILDELNLAPSEVLEALNRVLDDNRELFIPETSVTIKAHPDFRIFATQNPPGTYGGRKMLSRAFRNRFVELHFGEIPNVELQEILHQRCHMPRSYCQKLVNVMADLQRRRRGSATFAGKEGYITLRDLFRWGERYRLASSFDHLSYHDWDQHVADEGYLVLAGRVRKKEEQDIIQSVIEQKFKRTVDLNKLFSLNESTSLVTRQILEKTVLPALPEEFKHLVWTFNLRKLAVLVGKALEFKEPILLVGETGCGKTTVCQLLASIQNQLLYSVNCHQHSESSDFLGGLRPVREVEKSGKLFEWVDGPLIQAMKEGHMFLVDEISLADDSVLERLNSLLEPERKLLVSEKGSGDDIEVVAREDFHFIGTMNPGGDFGKKELSPALRNRLTEIWCEGPSSEEDLVAIIEHNLSSDVLRACQERGHHELAKSLIQFILWFLSTDFGKRISISVRDLLVWVKFMNVTVGGGGLDVGSAYLHGACLTLLDGIGSANTSTENLSSIREFKEMCVSFLLKQWEVLGGTQSRHLQVLLNPEVIPSNLLNRNDKFGIDPFYIKKVSSGKVENFMFNAPTTCLNLLRLLRALQVANRAVLLEGSPGVGKTSLVLALAEATGNKVTRINLSEQTDISDLFGTDLPVEGAAGGTFAWSDGPFLKALKDGHWILLDELNLASQSVIEGLNSVLDHRGEIYIPDLGRTFKANPEETKLFACQNPQRQGGARKGLPQSFLNRFTQVFVEPLTEKDFEVIVNGLFPDVKPDLLKKMVDFHNKLCLGTWTSPGFWEFNLRDLIRWGESLNQVVPGVAVETIYASRMPSRKDRNLILDTYREVFESSYPLASSLSPVLVSPTKLTIGEVVFSRLETTECYETSNGKEELLILRDQQPALKSLTLCVKMGWMAILVGKSGSGKTSLVHVLAHLAGKKLNTIPVSSAMDTTDLLGGFEQTDLWRHLERVGRHAESLLKEHVTALLTGGERQERRAADLCSLWHGYLTASHDSSTPSYQLKASEARFRSAGRQLGRLLEALPPSSQRDQLTGRLADLTALFDRSGLQAGGVFEWLDSLLIKCVEEGEWLLLENVNLCSGAVLDRLNSLLEKGGSLALGERGTADHVITPHPAFRIFLTLDPKHGTISRAMRNRGVEIYLDVPTVKTMHPFDLDTMLYNCGLNLEAHRHAVQDIHDQISDKEIGPEPPGLHHLLEVAYIACQNWKQGFPLFDSVSKASFDVYVKSRTLSSDQRKSLNVVLKEVLEGHKDTFSQSQFTTVDCFWPKYKTLSTFCVQEDSHSAIARQHSAVIYSILRNFERAKFKPSWHKDFTLKNILGSELSHYQSHCSSKYMNLEYDILTIIPYLITDYYCCATSVDVLVRKKWLDKTVNHIIRNHPYQDTLSTIFDGILHISNVIYDTLSPWKIFKERPWDIRHITSVNYQTPINNFFSRENKIFTHICFRIICVPFQAEEERAKNKTKWKLMSAIEYSKAVEIGNVDKWPYQNALVLELHPLLTAFDNVLISALTSEEVVLPNDLCADLIYQLAWRFKLSTAARRRLFKVSRTTGAPPSVCQETVSMLQLHYTWFKKHTVSAIMKLTEGCRDLSVKLDDFREILNSIDSSLDDGTVHMMPVSRKFRKLHVLPMPKSSTLQCDVSKKVQSIESELDIWKNSSKLISKINFLASDSGDEARRKVIGVTIQLLENKGLDLLEAQVSEIESSLKAISETGCNTCSLSDIIKIKTWPLMEYICLKLSIGVRRALLMNRNERSATDSLVLDSFHGWCSSTASVPPLMAGTVQTLYNVGSLDQSPDNVELIYLLTDFLNNSPALSFPLALINWEETLASDTEGYSLLDNKGFYMSHMPLVSLFLSKIITGLSSQQDMPSFALKAHKNLTNMFHLIKLLLWRNLPAMYSRELCDRSNETTCIKRVYINLLGTLKKAFNSKKKDCITSDEPGDIVVEIDAILKRLSERQGGGPSLEQNKVKPEVGISSSLTALDRLVGELPQTACPMGQWMVIGQAWAHIGRLNLLLFSLLDPVDPVKKQALKKQYVSEEISELRVLLCAEEVNKLLIGAPPSWPLKEEHEKRITLLESKYSNADKQTAIRPTFSLYEQILKDIVNLTSVLVSDEVFTPRLSNLVSVKSSNKSREEMEISFAETKSWLTSLSGISQKFYSKYYVEYPDIITPVLMAMSQINYGLKLVWTCAQKQMLQKFHRGDLTIQDHLSTLISFPVCGLKSALKILECCSSNEIITLLNKTHEDLTNFKEQENKIKLIKICVKIINSFSQSYVMKSGTNTFFQVLDHVVLCWHQLQEQEKIKKAQEDSIYINKMKLTEEELLEREMSEIFPSSREADFHDLEATGSLEDLGKVVEKEGKDPLKLSAEEIAEICSLHREVVRTAGSGHWLPEAVPAPDDPLDLLRDRAAVFSALIGQRYPAAGGEELDPASIPSLLLVAGLPASHIETASVPGTYNFYRDPNLPESKTCIPLLNVILKRVREFLIEWPDHPTLNQIVVIIERVLGFSMGSPLSRFLTGLELLLTKLHNWEENAHAGVSLAQHQVSLTQQIIQWRKLELSAWKGALSTAHLRIESNCTKYWFHIYSLVTSFVRSSSEEVQSETEEFVQTLSEFMESSSLGDFSVRLQLLHTFHCHALLLPQSDRTRIAISVLWNFYNYYNIVSSSVSRILEDSTSDVKDKVKKFVKIARWNDINYWSVKAAIEKTHHTLLKFIKEYERILNEPTRSAAMKEDIKNISALNLSSLRASNYLTACTLPSSYDDKELDITECLLYRLNFLLKKSKNLTSKVVKNCSYSKLLDNFEMLVEEVKETGKLLKELEIDPTIPKEKRKSAFKSLLQKKRKSVSDLFKTLSQIGLSYRSGLVMFDQKTIEFVKIPPFDIRAPLEVIEKRKSDKDWLACWKGADEVFYKAIAQLSQLKIVLKKPHQDIGPQSIERIKGFTSHSLNLLHCVKENLGKSSISLYGVRCQILQLIKISSQNYGVIDANFFSNKDHLKEVLEDIVYCLKQFVILLQACPEREVKFNESQPVPMIFPDSNKCGMVTALKHDPVWESTLAKVEAIINSASATLKQVKAVEKHVLFTQKLNSPNAMNIDIIVTEKPFKVVKEGYDQLRKIFSGLSDLEKCFEQTVNERVLSSPLTVSLEGMKEKIDAALTAYADVSYPVETSFANFDHLISTVPNHIKERLESFLNKALCIIQNVYKSHGLKGEEETLENKPSSEATPEETSAEPEETEIIVDGHLKEKIVERLLADINILQIPEVSETIGSILSDIAELVNESEKEACQGLFYHIHPILDQLVSIYSFFIVELTGSLKILGNFCMNLTSVFVDFSKNGYKIPEEVLEGEEEGEGERKGGLGLGEGEGEKDVSEQIESEDQLEDARRPGDYEKDEEKDCKEEEKGIEMSENFDAKLQDIEQKEVDEEKSDEESDKEEDLDKEMGDTEKGAETLDKQIWGSDSEEEEAEEEEDPPPEEAGDRGEQQTEKEMGAADEDKQEVGEKEGKEKKQPKEKELNEMDDQEVDDDQIDPYHGKQQPSPEVEPLEIEDDDDMALDEDEEKGSEGEDEENPFDIDSMKKSVDEKPEEEPKEEEKEGESKAEEGEDDDGDDEESPEVRGPEKEEEMEQEKEEEDIEEGSKDEEGKDAEIEEELEDKAGHEEAGGADEQPTQQEVEKSEKQDGSRDQVKGADDMDTESDTRPEETKAEGKEQSGSGKAEKMEKDSGGHRGQAGKRRNAGEREHQEKKQRPGQSEMERSLGESTEPLKKKLKTIGVQQEGREEEETPEEIPEEKMEEDAEADLYQHIHQAKESLHDTQTIDAATQEQAEQQPPTIGKEDEEKDELGEDEEINVLDDDDVEVDTETPAQQQSSEVEEDKPDKSKKNKGEGGGPLEEAKVEVEGEFVPTATVARGTESSYHTRLAEAGQQPLTMEELLSLRSQLEQQLGTWNQPPAKLEATAAWEKVSRLTSGLAQQLSEELRLVLEPTTASSLRGDFRTGKRINMRKVIPYIASQFRKDKIWLRRTKPSKREYQIIVAIDDSSSMADNHSKELAFESLAVVSKALNLIEAGELAVMSFGETVRVLHPLGEPFTENTGARLMQEMSFDEKRTRVGAAVEAALGLISQRGPDSAQLLVIISDGRCIMSEGEQTVRSAVRKASHLRLFIVFLIIDSPNSKDSVLDIRMATFDARKKLEMKSYIDSFPFPFYLILRDISNLPSVLSDALRQWFELVTDSQ